MITDQLNIKAHRMGQSSKHNPPIEVSLPRLQFYPAVKSGTLTKTKAHPSLPNLKAPQEYNNA